MKKYIDYNFIWNRYVDHKRERFDSSYSRGAPPPPPHAYHRERDHRDRDRERRMDKRRLEKLALEMRNVSD